MNSTFTFLSDLNQQGIRLWTTDDQLRINAPQGALTPELTAQLKARKAEILAFLRQNQSEPKTTPIQPTPRTEPLPLWFGQQRLWFLEQLGSGAIFTILAAFELQGPLDIPALEQTLTEVVRRHESLRTTFTQVEGQARQVIHSPAPVDLHLIDLRPLPPEEQEAEVRRLARQETLRPFDLSANCLIRATLLRSSNPGSATHLASQEHVLLLCMHHIASDGWSMGVLIRECAALYEAFAQGKPSPLPELPIQYADFAVWQRNRLQGEILEKQLSYWKTRLAGAPELLQLPTDYPRPPVQTFLADKLDFQIDAGLTQQLRQLCQQSGATLFMTLLAAFQVLLARYSGQDDIVVHSPIANRNQKAIEPLIGFFVNDIALRADLSGDPTFLAFMDQVRRLTQAAYDHQDLPFDRIVEVLKPQRNLGYNPVAQVSFALQNASMSDFKLPGLCVRPLDLEVQRTRMDLEVHLWEQGGGLAGSFIYSTDLFAPATIARMIGHFQRLLAGIVADPEQRISDLPLLTEAERRQLLIEWNATETNAPNDKCLHRLFEEQVERSPDANAVVFENRRLTYQELNARANQLAHYLHAQGVGPETLVGLCVKRSLEMVVGMLGILKAGGAYVPLDPAYPAERTASILQEIETPILLTQERLRGDLPVQSGRVIALDSNWAEIATYSTANPNSPVAPHNLAYVIYTSGSAGKPKGVLIEHESVAAHCTQYKSFYALTPADRALQLASFHFDASIEQIFPALLAGASVILPEWDLDPVSFSQNLQRFGVTILDLAGAYLRVLLDEWFKTPALIADSSLRIVIVGADAMPVDVIGLWRQTPLHKRARLFNVYGPTETTVAATIFEVTEDFDSNRPRIPIGPPLPNKKVYILDPHRQPVPIGVPGELYIGGIGPARGYLNQPELTKEKFIDLDDLPLIIHEIGGDIGNRRSKTQTRVYRTGDLVRRLPDGNIDFLGRIDQQVKIRGFRVELGEIETVLGQHPDVEESAVLVREDESGQKRLIAYLTPQLPDDRIPELRNYLNKKLPDYMLPDAFVPLGHLPRSPVGILDRKALPAPDAILATVPYKPPGNATEQKIAQIWERLLNRKELSIHDSFFEVGGHSLLAMQAHSLLRRDYPSLKLADLFTYPTIRSLAICLTQTADDNSRRQASQERGAKRRVHQAARQQKRKVPTS